MMKMILIKKLVSFINNQNRTCNMTGCNFSSKIPSTSASNMHSHSFLTIYEFKSQEEYFLGFGLI